MENFPSLVKKIKISFTPAVIIELFYWLFFTGAVLIKCFYFQFTTRLNSRPFNSLTNIYMYISLFAVLLVIISIFILLFNKKRRIALLLLDIFLTLLIISDTIYYRYYNSAITIPVLYQLGLVGSVGDSILNLMKVKDIIYIVDFPFLIAGLILLKSHGSKGGVSFPIIKRVVVALIVFVIGLASFQYAYKNVDSSIFYYDNNYIMRYLGIEYFHYYDIKRFIKDDLLRDKTLTAGDSKAIENYFEQKPNDAGKHTGIAKGKNLIIIQVEALQNFVINMKTDAGQELTPNLNKLINDSVYFKNIYYQIGGGNTADAEFLSNVSLYPAKEGCAYFRFPTNTYHSLGNILKEQGYSTYAFHANNPTFWNRNVMYKSIGLDTFMSNKNYKLDEYVGWGLGDTSFYKQSLDSIDKSKPFYGFFLSLSSHFPFKYPFYEDYPFNVGKYEGTFMGYYLKSINYADYALGQLIQDLKARGLYDNTVLVIYGDHMAIPKEHSEELMSLLGTDYSDFEWAKLQRVPLLIHYPGLENGTAINTTGGEIDILPTIANLMQLKTPYAMGKDLLNTSKGYAVLRNSSIITDNYLYLSSTRQIYDIQSGVPIKNEEYSNEIKTLQKELSISDIIIEKNAFKKDIFK